MSYCSQDIGGLFKQEKVSTMSKSGKLLAKEIEAFTKDIDEAVEVVTKMEDTSANCMNFAVTLLVEREIVRVEMENLQIVETLNCSRAL